MGMDIFGNNGNYFRANIWTWPAIMSLVAQTEVLPQELVNKMQFNDGIGPNARQATQLANALEALVEGKPDDLRYCSTGSNSPAFGVAKVVRDLIFSAEDEAGIPNNQSEEYCEGSCVEMGHLREFIRFCRQSGGFSVC